tara:strand:+ start:1344 stop:1970 length:627 start_codon:yes stop_codon:yes gene_type:complete
MGLLSDRTGLHLLTLDILCLRELGPQFIAYEPETLLQEMRLRHGPIGRVTSERLMACQVLHANAVFWSNWEAFEKITASISGEVAIFSYSQPPDPEEAAIALKTAGQFDSHEYSEEVKRYIAACCLHDGLFYLEGPLEMSMPYVLEYIDDKKIDVDMKAVQDLLKKTEREIVGADSVEEVQVNKVLSVRRAIRTFESEIQKQIKRIKR